MDWSDAAETVGEIAPVLGTALGGPAGGALGAVVARTLGVAAEPGEVAQAVRQDPEAAVKLRGIEADLEKTLLEGRAQVVTAEAQGDSWLQRSWRPLTMLTFTALVAAHWLGFTAENLSPAAVEGLLDIVRVGLGGYIIGRSAEKVTRSVTGSGLLDHLKAKVRK